MCDDPAISRFHKIMQPYSINPSFPTPSPGLCIYVIVILRQLSFFLILPIHSLHTALSKICSSLVHLFDRRWANQQLHRRSSGLFSASSIFITLTAVRIVVLRLLLAGGFAYDKAAPRVNMEYFGVRGKFAWERPGSSGRLRMPSHDLMTKRL